MKKLPLAIALLVLIMAFAGADYALNVSRSGSAVTADTPDQAPNLTEELLRKDPASLELQLVRRNRTAQLFEKIDLSALASLRIYQSTLQKQSDLPILLYEVQGPSGQGGLTYLNTKLKFLDQIDATETVNETNEFGHSSFYFNDLNAPDSSFLVVQILDNLYGFQFNKKSTSAFSIIKSMINTLLNS